MTESTATAADPGPPPPAPAGTPQPENRFFEWLRGLGVPRLHSWAGGVCAGLALRMGIDPIIVRGLFVVAAIVGLPALLVYALAWALLPDTDGRIVAQQWFRGRFEPATIAIGILVLISVFPVVPWLLGTALWPIAAVFDGWSGVWSVGGSGVFGTVLTVLLLAGVVALVIWLAVRASQNPRGGSASGPWRASTDPAAPGSLSPEDAGDSEADEGATAPNGPTSQVSEAAASVALADAPTEIAPRAPGATANDDEIARWREKHEEWLAQRDEWRRGRHHADQTARTRAQAERDAAARAYAAQADARRAARRASRPRTSFMYIVAALGAALAAGAVAVLAALGSREVADYAGAVGVLVAAVVVALSMVIAGIARRRSGFLSSVAIVLLVVGLITALAAGPRALLLGATTLDPVTYDRTLSQPFGSTSIAVSPLDPNHDVEAGAISVRKVSGDTHIDVHPGTALSLTADLSGGGVSYTRVDQSSTQVLDAGVIYPHDGPGGQARYEWFLRNDDPGAPVTTSQQVSLVQGTGSVFITIFEP